MESYWNLIEEIVKESDIILYVLDARLVRESRNSKIEEIIKTKRRAVIYVLNKSDLVSKQDLELGVEKLRRETDSEIVCVSSKQKKTVRLLLTKIKQTFAKYGKRKDFIPIIKKPYREAKGDIVIGVVGYPNVGKSSIINSISFKKKAPVSKKSGTTHGIHWIKAGDNIKLIDTPGVIPLGYRNELQLGLIAARDNNQIKEPTIVAARIIEEFMKRKKSFFENCYKIKIPENLNSYEILEFIAKEKNHLKKGGVPDDIRTSQMIIQDWQEGKLKF